MSSYKNNKDGTLTHVSTNLQVNQENTEQYVTESELVAGLAEKQDNSYVGKTVVHMGDSWVQLYNIAELAAEKVGYNVINVGFQATAICDTYTWSPSVTNVDKFSLIKLAQAIESNIWTEQDEAMHMRWGNQLDKLKAIDWSSVDVLILSYGVNDYGYQSVPSDTSARDTESVCGALKTAIGILNNINPNMEIIVTTPCYKYDSPNVEYMTSYKKRYLQDEYRNAIGLTAQKCGVKLVDMRAISEINDDNYSITLEADGLHPTTLGQQLWANAFAKSMQSGFSGAFNTDIFDVELEEDNLCNDSEKFTVHGQWNATYVSDSVKYLCTLRTQQYGLCLLGQAYFDNIPVGSIIKLSGYGKKINSQNHRLGFYIYNADKSTQLADNFSYAINNTSDSAITYSLTTTTEYTNCWVIFYVKQMSTWENGKALVRDMKCTVDIAGKGVVTENKLSQSLSEIDGINPIYNYQLVDTPPISGKFVSVVSGALIDYSDAMYCEFDVRAGETYRIVGSYNAWCALYALFDASGSCVATYPSSQTAQHIIEGKSVTIPDNITRIRCSTLIGSISTLRVYKVTETNQYDTINTKDVLYGKKWYACGDSFTAGYWVGYVDSEGHTMDESDAFDPIEGKWKTYPYWIQNRTGINPEIIGSGGIDFTNISGAINPFSASTSEWNYTLIDSDADYVTLQFGLNELGLTAEQIGSQGDTTNETLWGAYDVVIKHILTQNPRAKIGIILSDDGMSQAKTYHDTLIEIAEYYMIPYLDMTNGVQVPCGIGGRLDGTHSANIVTMRNNAFMISQSNVHPTPAAHEYRSTFIENFLRSL